MQNVGRSLNVSVYLTSALGNKSGSFDCCPVNLKLDFTVKMDDILHSWLLIPKPGANIINNFDSSIATFC